jgi:predicted RNA-binding Zn-ribbon protein involved in translation (DUF1610 family)
VTNQCPKCLANLDGGAIPKKLRRHYSPPYRWSRLIGIEILGDDYISSWKCPDCGYRTKDMKEFQHEVHK